MEHPSVSLLTSNSPAERSDPRVGDTTVVVAPRPLNKPHLCSPFFTEAVAEARATSDTNLIQRLTESYRLNIYQNYPHVHPTAVQRPTPYCLRPYDKVMYPHCLGRTFQHLQHLDTWCGKILQCLISPSGVTDFALGSLVAHNIGCTICKCMFSDAGFHSHAPSSKCGNRGDASQSVSPSIHNTSYAPTEGEIAFLNARSGFLTRQYLEVPTAVAFLEWNSRIGIPCDVWAMIVTSVIQCYNCRLFRTHKAHIDHYGVEGACSRL